MAWQKGASGGKEAVKVAEVHSRAAALESEVLADYMRMVEIYGSGCVRLVQMVKREKGDVVQLRRCLEKEMNRVVRNVLKRWGWVVGD